MISLGDRSSRTQVKSYTQKNESTRTRMKVNSYTSCLVQEYTLHITRLHESQTLTQRAWRKHGACASLLEGQGEFKLPKELEVNSYTRDLGQVWSLPLEGQS